MSKAHGIELKDWKGAWDGSDSWGGSWKELLRLIKEGVDTASSTVSKVTFPLKAVFLNLECKVYHSHSFN